jgi:integrase
VTTGFLLLSILAVLLGCGLRRSELVALEVRQVEQRENRWVIVDFRGKGGRKRTVPAWVKNAIDAWTAAAEIRGGADLPLDRQGGTNPKQDFGGGGGLVVGEGVRGRDRRQKSRPHDLRRTCAKLCRKSGGDLEQIQMLLGHASIQTTEKYLGMQQNLIEALNDKLGIVDADG